MTDEFDDGGPPYPNTIDNRPGAHGSEGMSLHDSIEDQGLTHNQLLFEFGKNIADGVLLLSDMEEGNRATRKQLSCKRLSGAPGWVQTIKCADLISNTSSIVKHDPEFAKVYLKEKRDLLDAMENADSRLWHLAESLCRADW